MKLPPLLLSLFLFAAPGFLRASSLAIESGNVSGVVLDDESGLEVFRGIPFAKPPVGELRWRAPQPVDAWKGVRVCDTFGAASLQKSKRGKEQEMSEDCLYLNVWTKRSGDRSAKLPVMVWIHGGGLNQGWAHKEFYDGSAFANRDVVLVSLNYRLGVMGFFAHPGLSAESPHGVSGNYGFMDQIAGLEWVRENIAAFGGDPDNVTIFGESAGGSSVAVLSAAPAARGLFHQAILQSPWMFGYAGLAQPNILRLRDSVAGSPSSEEMGEDWAQRHVASKGLEAMAELRAIPGEKLIQNSPNFARVTIDGWFLPDHPAKVFQAGEQANVPMIIGTTSDEGNFFAYAAKFENRSEFENELNPFYGEATDSVMAHYPGETAGELRRAGTRFITDSWFVHPARQLLDGMSKVASPVFQYDFAKKNSRNPNVGAPHAIELRFVFNTLNNADEFPENQILADKVTDYWVQFARAGNPNGPGLPEWPEYQSNRKAYLILDDAIAIGTDLRKDACDALEAASVGIY